MALQDQQAEPSMEEILASIRRIISEEEQAPEPVLELTEQEAPAPAAARDAEPDDDIVFEEAGEPDVYEPEPPAPAASVAEAPPAPSAAPAALSEALPASAETILSPPSASAAAGALARLADGLRIADTHNQTVEGVVRELLRPMLKDWLDRNLPAIVEARVEAELERIARMVR